MVQKVIQTPLFKNYYNGFDMFIVAQNYSTGKGKSYQYNIKDFLIWLERKGVTNLKVLQSNVVAYSDYLIQRPKHRFTGTLSSSTINQNLFSLSLFFDYLLAIQEIQSSVYIPRYNRTDGKERNIATIEEIHLMYDHCKNRLERCIIDLAFGCGLRRGEMQDLDTSDLNLSSGILVVKEGKGRKRREVPMSDVIVKSLREYLINERPIYLREYNKQELAFFINNWGTRMQGADINDKLKEIILRTQNQELLNKEITLHCLRHSIAAALLDKGASIEFVRDFLGHASIDTSHIYARKRKNKQRQMQKIQFINQ